MKGLGGMGKFGRLALSSPLLVSMGVAMAQDVPKGLFAMVNGQPLGDTLLDVAVQANVRAGSPTPPVA